MTHFFIQLFNYISVLSFLVRARFLGIPAKANYKVISLGLGQQSTTLYLMSSLGEIERADVAIFSDTGSESSDTYKHLVWLKKWARKNKGIPILVVGRKSLFRDLIHGLGKNKSRFSSIPAYTKDMKGKKGMLKRQCTEDYKTYIINKTIRKLYGLRTKKRAPLTEVWLGISQEELERLKFSHFNWQVFVYPFLNIRATKSDFERRQYTPIMRRCDCTAWLQAHGFPIPPKSACIFCPYQGNARWLDMKENRPEEWKDAVVLDRAIRNSTAKGVKQPIFLHRSAVPLEEADLQENQLDLFNAECSGVCGI